MSDVVENTTIKSYLARLSQAIDTTDSFLMHGKVSRVIGMRIEVTGLAVALNTQCEIIVSSERKIIAEVVSFSNQCTFLLATENIEGIQPGAVVIPLLNTRSIKVGDGLIGRVIDATGKPFDALGPIHLTENYPLFSQPINPLSRSKITKTLDVGVRAINALFTIGGQRIGIFAGSGVGKSILLGMMTRFSEADIVVVGLIGERGREVKEFVEDILGDKGLAHAVVVASPSDTEPLMRVNGAITATAIAEYYRDQGKNVLLIVDSLTRYAQAYREIALSAGELPATKGYTPSVFGKLSQLVERSGNGSDQQGSITAFYTVLVDGDDLNDPVVDHIRSILDGHIVLSRELADSGHFPAIDVEKSISRVMISVVTHQWQKLANQFKKIASLYTRNKDLINIGMYQKGSDSKIDEAINFHDLFDQFLRQEMTEQSTIEDGLSRLSAFFENREQL
jgi:flagellum-specific ATP synthase